MLATEQLVFALKSIAGKVSSSLCSSGLDVLAQVHQAADIGLDGTQDPTKVCDGISIGLGYETASSLLGAPAPPQPVKGACGV